MDESLFKSVDRLINSQSLKGVMVRPASGPAHNHVAVTIDKATWDKIRALLRKAGYPIPEDRWILNPEMSARLGAHLRTVAATCKSSSVLKVIQKVLNIIGQGRGVAACGVQ